MWRTVVTVIGNSVEDASPFSPILCGLIMLVTSTAACPAAPSDNLQGSHPNVLVVLTDDQGWGDLSLNGNTNLSTPHIDRLARQGASWDRFYVCPVCSPTRAEFLTGLYHPRCGVYSTSAGGERLRLDRTTIADRFRSAGYTTAAFGKWHSGTQYPYHPLGRGFDQFYGFCSGHWGHYFSPPLDHNGELVRGNGYLTDDFTQRAIDFIRGARDKPFFAYVAYNTPHSPMQVPAAYWERFRNRRLDKTHRLAEREEIDHTRAALAMCENIDDNVGRLLHTLDEAGLTQSTIVVFFCDNGPNGFRWNGDMKGRKGSTDEGGVRSPLLMRFPPVIPAGRIVRRIGAAIDLFPTLANLAGIDLRTDALFDGIDLTPEATGAGASHSPDRIIFSHWRGRVSARSQRFRFDDAGQLFDIDADPGQRRDVAADFPSVARRMSEATQRWRRDVLSELSEKPLPFPVGSDRLRHTHLPARDARFTGDIERSNRFPNCSYLTGWSSTNDTITWDVDVRRQGTYEATIYYTCSENDVGSEIELALRSARTAATVKQAYDSPLIGQTEDRVARKESYVKDFAPLSLGAIDLPLGRGDLTLRARHIAGKKAIDLRLLVLTLVP